jgi:glycosyltransferase involved in cell wall biosynthesis
MKLPPPPQISTVPIARPGRPRWSVMIPTYDSPSAYLEQTLRSVLDQDPGLAHMQIEVVDDCSQNVNVAELVERCASDRVGFSRTSENLGLAGCWNSIIERSRGFWIHILHQDDYLLPGFYRRLASAAEEHPEVSLSRRDHSLWTTKT